MKLGVYGGTFNPIHLAHLIVADRVHESLALDQLLFIPCAIPPLKPADGLIDGRYRLEMIGLAIRDNPAFRVSDIELRRGGRSFTIDTIRALASEYQVTRDELFLIMGADNLKAIHTWKQPEAIQSLCRLVVVQRPQHPVAFHTSGIISDWISVDAPLLDISSTNIRQRLHAGKSVRYLIPGVVIDYIREKSLYL